MLPEAPLLRNKDHSSSSFLCTPRLQEYFADELGVLSPNQLQVGELYAGEVIY